MFVELTIDMPRGIGATVKLGKGVRVRMATLTMRVGAAGGKEGIKKEIMKLLERMELDGSDRDCAQARQDLIALGEKVTTAYMHVNSVTDTAGGATITINSRILFS